MPDAPHPFDPPGYPLPTESEGAGTAAPSPMSTAYLSELAALHSDAENVLGQDLCQLLLMIEQIGTPIGMLIQQDADALDLIYQALTAQTVDAIKASKRKLLGLYKKLSKSASSQATADHVSLTAIGARLPPNSFPLPGQVGQPVLQRPPAKGVGGAQPSRPTGLGKPPGIAGALGMSGSPLAAAAGQPAPGQPAPQLTGASALPVLPFAPAPPPLSITQAEAQPPTGPASSQPAPPGYPPQKPLPPQTPLPPPQAPALQPPPPPLQPFPQPPPPIPEPPAKDCSQCEAIIYMAQVIGQQIQALHLTIQLISPLAAQHFGAAAQQAVAAEGLPLVWIDAPDQPEINDQSQEWLAREAEVEAAFRQISPF